MSIECFADSDHGTIFSGFETEVPIRLLRYPKITLARRLRRAGLTSRQATDRMESLGRQATTTTKVNADLVVAPMHGKNLAERTFSKAGRIDTNLGDQIIKSAILTVVGEGRYIANREIFDSLAMDHRRVAIISGLSDQKGGTWTVNDSGQHFFCYTADMVEWVEKRGDYGMIVAHLDNRTGKVPLTRSLPFFYITGSLRDPKIKRHYYLPK